MGIVLGDPVPDPTFMVTSRRNGVASSFPLPYLGIKSVMI